MGAKLINQQKCGFLCCKPQLFQRFANIKWFVAIMCMVIGVQGMYLGYMVGIQTVLERRFEITSYQIGILLAMYDIGHTFAVLVVGYFGSGGHKPHWTGWGTILSAVAMIGLALPHFIWSDATALDEKLENHRREYIVETECSRDRWIFHQKRPDLLNSSSAEYCTTETHNEAYILLAACQFLAGAAAAPFNTLAYIYIDDNVGMRQSPFYLGLLTSMYAFGPAIGFGLSALCNHLYWDLSVLVPVNIAEDNPNWIGAWWLGFLICGLLYMLLGMPLFCFPLRMPPKNPPHPGGLDLAGDNYPLDELNYIRVESDTGHRSCTVLLEIMKEMPSAVWNLLKNPVYTSMMFAWIFGAYLVGGFGTYLPKYIEHQYHQTAAMSSLYAGLISIGSVATSTAVGGYILTRFNIGPRRATLLLILSWTLILATYLIGMALGCKEPTLVGNHVSHDKWDFKENCNRECGCESVRNFDPVCYTGDNNVYFSPCHAGCEWDQFENQWANCRCTDFSSVTEGLCPTDCIMLPIYVTVMFVGLFAGNMFFMTTMMVILRCVRDEQKSLSLSFASCATNIFGFIPSPIIFGAVIDSACTVWHAHCPHSGNCIIYDNAEFRHKYHLGNVGFQALAVVSVVITYIFSRKFRFPEDDFGAEDSISNYDTPESGTKRRDIKFADEVVL